MWVIKLDVGIVINLSLSSFHRFPGPVLLSGLCFRAQSAGMCIHPVDKYNFPRIIHVPIK